MSKSKEPKITVEGNSSIALREALASYVRKTGHEITINTFQKDLLERLLADSEFVENVLILSAPPDFYSSVAPLLKLRVQAEWKKPAKESPKGDRWAILEGLIDLHFKSYGLPIKRVCTPENTARLIIFGDDSEEAYVFANYNSYCDGRNLIREEPTVTEKK